MAKLVRDDIDKFFEYGIDLSSKTLYMGSLEEDWDGGEAGVDFRMARNVVQGLLVLDNIKKEEPLTIIMNNPGGDWYHGIAIYDAIKACESKVIIKAFGHAMSMGSIILQAADERVMSPNAKMMIHYGYCGHFGTSKNHLVWAEEEKKVMKDMENIYLEKIHQKDPKFTRTKLRKMLDPDTILTAQEAIDLGLADSVL